MTLFNWLTVILLIFMRSSHSIDIDKMREERATKAQEMLRFMNRSVDPCRDFHGFACGNWLTYQQIFTAAPNQLISAHDQMDLKVKQQIQLILEESMTSYDSRSTRNIKDFFRACKTAESSSPLQRKFLREFVRKNGGLPNGTEWQDTYNWLRIIARLRHYYGLNILISLEVTRNSLGKLYTNDIILGEPKDTILPSELCSYIAIKQQYDRNQEPYETIQRDVKENIKSWFELRELDALRLAGDIVRFEFELCKRMRQEDIIREHSNEQPLAHMKRNINIHGVLLPHTSLKSYNLLQLNDLYNMDLKGYVDLCLEDNVQTKVHLRNPTYFQHLAKLPDSWPMHSFATYIMYTALSVINFPRHDTLRKRQVFCVDRVIHFFPKIIGGLYSHKYAYLRNEMKHDIDTIGKSIKKALQRGLEVSSLDQISKESIKQRLQPIQFALRLYQNVDNTMTRDIQYMDYWHKLEAVMSYRANQSLIGGDNILEAFRVNVEFDTSTNAIQVGLGLLMAPFHSQYYPTAFKYALLGHNIARELIRALDIVSSEHLDQRTDCFRTQYSNYLYNTPEDFRNASKLRDIVVDSGALNIAFDAYLNWLETVDPGNYGILFRETLLDVNFSNTQLFFLHFAQTRCASKYMVKPQLDFSPINHHTVERYEVNGPLSNNLEFAREFNCKLGLELNPDDKCLVY